MDHFWLISVLRGVLTIVCALVLFIFFQNEELNQNQSETEWKKYSE